ncbi:MAG: hypothetical protein AB7L13_12570 [Acidimicrobiia bacterium]
MDRTVATPWAIVVRFAAISACLMTMTLALSVQRHSHNPLDLVQPGTTGPSADVFRRDFPDASLIEGIGHDGQQFYAIARQPMHWKQVAVSTDRPRYRLQRPLYPWLAWALHPTGGGLGLVYALVAVNALAMFGGGVATGLLSFRLGGRAELALIFPLIPGVFVSSRLSVADGLALALLTAALAATLSPRPSGRIGAALFGVASALAKESMIPMLLARRWRSAIPAIFAMVGLSVALRLVFTEVGAGVQELTFPFRGLLESASKLWIHGHELFAMASVVSALVLGVVALTKRDRRSSPLWWPIATQVAFVPLLGVDVLGLNLNGSRATAPLLLLSIVALATPARVPATSGEAPASAVVTAH